MLHELIAPFELAYMQRALIELMLLAVVGGVLGTWIVLRGLGFYAHATGTATFPGLVVAGPWGLPPALAALGAALLCALGIERLSRARRVDHDGATALALTAALAVGVVLASDVYEAGAGVDGLLFGTLIGLSAGDVGLTAAVALAVLALDAALGRTWLATGFDPASAPALGVPARLGDRALLVLVAAVVVVAVDAVGALLVAAVLVLPAATVRLVARTLPALRRGAVGLGALEGVAGLWVADRLDVPPGPALAVLGGLVFGLVALSPPARGGRARVAAAGADP